MFTPISFLDSNLLISLKDTGNSKPLQLNSSSYFFNLLTISGLLPTSSHFIAAIIAHLKHSISEFLGFSIAFFSSTNLEAECNWNPWSGLIYKSLYPCVEFYQKQIYYFLVLDSQLVEPCVLSLQLLFRSCH